MNRRRSIGYIASLAFAACSTAAPAEASNPVVEPFVRVEKTRFAEGENVFFWVGVRAVGKTNPVPPIPRPLQNSCRLTIVRPDGTTKTEPVGWPPDGPEGSTWTGGWGLGEKAMPGRYTLVFAFAGRKSLPTTLIVERTPIVSKIHVAFAFGAAEGGDTPDTPVTLTVHNDSEQTIRFPHRIGFSAPVWVHFSGQDEKRTVQTFYPDDKLLNADAPHNLDFSFDTFTETLAKRVPTLTLKPGETYRQRLSLRAAIAAAARTTGSLPPGRYAVLFGTTMQFLIGEPNGAFTSLCPMRVSVENTALCAVPSFLAGTATRVSDYP